MQTHSHQQQKRAFHWLGMPAQSKGSFVNFNIYQVRCLFERLVILPMQQRQQVIGWGLYVADPAVLALVAWVNWCNEFRHSEFPLNSAHEWRNWLFKPTAVKTQATAQVQRVGAAFVGQQ